MVPLALAGRGGASAGRGTYHGPAAALLDAADARLAANAAEAARRARSLDDRAQRDLSFEVAKAVAAARSSSSSGLFSLPSREEKEKTLLVPFEVAAASLGLEGAGGADSFSAPRQTRSRGARKDADRLYLTAHRSSFGAALDAEQREEAAATRARLTTWPRARLIAEGCTLFGLSPAPDGALFGDVIVRLSVPGGRSLPFHAFTPGDNVLLSRGDEAAVGGGYGGSNDDDDEDDGESINDHGGSEGILLEYSRQWIRVALAPGAARAVLPERGGSRSSSGNSGGSKSALFRLDLFGNSTAHDRCLAALDSFAQPPAATGDDAASATLRRALMGPSRGFGGGGLSAAAAAATAPPWAGGSKRSEKQRAALKSALFDLASPRYSLNESQIAAGRAALTRTLTLWQGPPGTGKTRALAALVDAAARSKVFTSGSGGETETSSSSASRPILVCAASNVAVDNIILALLKLQERGGERGGASDREDGGDDNDDSSSSSENRHHHRQPPALRIVRLGPPAKASPSVRHLSLAALAAATPAGKAAAAARASAATQPPGALGRASREKAAQLEGEARRRVLSGAHVVAATTVAAGDEETFGGGRAGSGGKGAEKNQSSFSSSFAFVAVDEATQATEPSSLVPLILRKATSALLVGDPRQLPPTVVSREAAAAGLGASLFERLSRERERGGADFGEEQEQGDETSSSSSSSSLRPFLLDTQYRMHPALSEFPSWRWYSGRLRDGVGEAQRRPARGIEWPVDLRRRRKPSSPSSSDSSSSAPPLLPVLFVPCDSPEQRCGLGSSMSSGGDDDSSSPHSTGGGGTTFRNDGEAALILSALSGLLAAGDVPPSEIGIVTPYAGQARALRAALGDSAASELIEVKTVDGFQGREKSVVLFSAVRSNFRGNVGFLADGRRLNVALTRSKRGLLVVGNPRTLACDADWREWLKWWREATSGGG